MTRTASHLHSLFCFFSVFFIGFTTLSAQSDFSEFPWLNDIVNIEDCCQYQKVTAYQSSVFTFIYIEKDNNCTDEGGTLYFQDGTFYCGDALGLDCRTAYGLSEDFSRTLWTCQAQLEEVAEIYIVCAGDSVFLPAIQTLPIPPAGPANPDGGPPSIPCQPLLSKITISPEAGSTAKGLEGFMVLSTANTVYEVRSDGFCGGPGSVSTSFATERYQVILEEECEKEEVNCENVLEQEWIVPFLGEKCTGKIYQIEYNGQEAIYITTLCGCVDATDILFSCSGEVLCSLGGNTPPNSDGLCEETVREQLIDDNAIWKPACDCPCPVDNNPVCGVDGKSYESACDAFCAGVEVSEDFPCEEKVCLPLAALNINANFCNSCFSEVSIYSYEGADYLVTRENSPICSDGITTVTNCDSTVVLCYDGGIAGFNQCEEFFKGALLVETVWSRFENCGFGEVVLAAPCKDLADVDFGLCEAVMGVGIVDGKCKTISGCLNFESNGVDYSKAIFPTVEICEQSCNGNGGADNTPEIFNEYTWLGDLVDPDNCAGTFIEVYDFSSYSFVHVATRQSSALYYEDGTFYCMDLPNYDCRALYGLTKDEITQTFTCGTGPSSPDGGSRVIVNNYTGVSASALQVFPNPTNGLVQVRMPNNGATTSTLRVFDMYGRMVKEMTVVRAATSIDLSAEDAGIYMVEWQSGGERDMMKVIKQ